MGRCQTSHFTHTTCLSIDLHFMPGHRLGHLTVIVFWNTSGETCVLVGVLACCICHVVLVCDCCVGVAVVGLAGLM